MAAPKFINEITAASSLSGGAAVAIFQDGSTFRTDADSFLLQNITGQFQVVETANVANYLTIAGAQTGGSVKISAVGPDTDADLALQVQGTDGSIIFRINETEEQVRIVRATGGPAVNRIELKGGATGDGCQIAAEGDDSTIDLLIYGRGTLSQIFLNDVLRVRRLDNAVNYIRVDGSLLAAGIVTLSAQGDDSNLDLILTPKGTGNVTLTTGKLKFPAAQSASSDANTLDDYEEGSWTPVLTFATPGDLSVAYSAQVGRYTKIGNLVTMFCTIATSSFTHGSASGVCTITGNPFTSENVSGLVCTGAVSYSGVTKASYGPIVARLNANASSMTLQASGSGVGVNDVSAADMPSGGSVILRFVIQFRV